jgi:hypothetical protein
MARLSEVSQIQYLLALMPGYVDIFQVPGAATSFGQRAFSAAINTIRVGWGHIIELAFHTHGFIRPP